MDTRAYPAGPVVGVAAVVLHEGAVLLIQRGREPMRGRWSLPGGALLLGETLRDGVVREVLEETGLCVEPMEMIVTLDRIVRDDDGSVRYHYVLVDWRCKLNEAAREPVAGDDAAAARWVPLGSLGDATYAVEELTREVIGQAVAAERAIAPTRVAGEVNR